MAKKANLARAVAPPLNASHLANALRTFAPSAKRNNFYNSSMSLKVSFKKLITTNKPAIIIGILIGGVATRFLEDSNLLVNSVLTLMTTTATLAISLLIKKLFAAIKR